MKHLPTKWRALAKGEPNTMSAAFHRCAAELEEALADSGRVWHSAERLPTPSDTPLLLELADGQRVKGYRREYVRDKKKDPLGYTCEAGREIHPKYWSYF